MGGTLWAIALAGLGASCFDGAGALGLPCREDGDCGKGQRCEAGFCGGPVDGGTTTASTGTSSGSSESGQDSSSSGAESTGPQPGCGNAVVDDGEDCDPGTGLDEAGCNFDCSAVVCGDGYPNLAAGEECDDGNGTSVDDCTPECRTTLFSDDMNGPGTWMVEIPTWGSGADEFMLTSGWQHGIPEPDVWQSGVYSSSSGTTRLISPPIAFPRDPGAGFQYELHFRHRLRFDGNPNDVGDTPCPGPLAGDGAVVWVMDDQGMPILRVGPPPEHPEELDDVGGCASGAGHTNPLYDQGGPVFTGISPAGLTDVELPLPMVDGQTVRLVFEIGYDCANCWESSPPMGAGWTIDDVVVAPFPF